MRNEEKLKETLEELKRLREENEELKIKINEGEVKTSKVHETGHIENRLGGEKEENF